MAGWKGRSAVSRRQPEWSAVCGLFHMRLKEAAAVLNVSHTRLRRLCRKNGLSQWPGKKTRSTNDIKKRAAALGIHVGVGSPLAESAGYHLLAKIVERKKVEDDMARIQEPVTNHPPRELITLNMIDKVGSSSNDCN